MNEFVKNLQRQASENPILAIGVGAGAAQAASKLLQSLAANKNSRTYKKEIDRRVKQSKK